MDDTMLDADQHKATLGPEPVNIYMANCPLVASQQRGGGGTVALTLQGAVEQSRVLQTDCQVDSLSVFSITLLGVLNCSVAAAGRVSEDPSNYYCCNWTYF